MEAQEYAKAARVAKQFFAPSTPSRPGGSLSSGGLHCTRMSEARIHPPSEQRVSEARRLGHVPVVPLAGLFGAFTALAFALGVSGPALWRALVALLRTPLERAARGEPPAHPQLADALLPLALPLASLLGCAFLATALASFVAQGPAFGFAARSRLRLVPLAPSRTSRLLFVLGLPLVAALSLRSLLRAELADVVALLSDFALHLSAWLALCALLDASLARTAHLRSLWLTRSEHRAEQREQHGSPEVRAARQRARSEVAS
jgi:flagellar biosynthesis protein FlhB